MEFLTTSKDYMFQFGVVHRSMYIDPGIYFSSLKN